MNKFATALALATALVAVVFVAPAATAGPGDRACMERYAEWTVGPLTVVSRDTCTYEVYYNGQPVELTSTNAANPLKDYSYDPESGCFVWAPENTDDAGSALCVNTTGPCYVSYTWITIAGPYTICLVGVPEISTAAAAPNPLEGLTVSPKTGCVSYVPPGSADMGWAVCVSAKGPCYVGYTEMTIAGPRTLCLVGTEASAAKPVDGLTVGGGCVGYNPSWWSDAGETFCADADGPCYVSQSSNTIAGPRERCVVGYDGSNSAAKPSLPGVELNCYSIANTYRVGPFTVYQQSSCEYDVAGAVGAPHPLDNCYSIGNTWYVGPVTLRQHSSCSYSFYVDSGYFLH
ncbi:MAG TPA: hypothetical protein VNZ52_13545 [Candidatus Thermoplasmatota archaeon]|nr:hypothetical protein [Candidatus Thermoplasmatota archaeon]